MTPFVIGLAGGTASGKTTLALAMTQALGERVLYISHDRYYVRVPHPPSHNFDEPSALNTPELVRDLDRLRAGQSAELPDYDFPNHQPHVHTERVEPRPVLLVEGLFVLAEPALRERLDLRVFVHCDADIRLVRRIRRDVVERGWRVEQVLERYLRDVRPGHLAFIEPSRAHADLVLDGTEPVEALLAQTLRVSGLAGALGGA